MGRFLRSSGTRVLRFAVVALSGMMLVLACGQSEEDRSPALAAAAGGITSDRETPEAGDAAEESAAIAPRTNVSEDDAAAMEANDFGTPLAVAEDRIEVRRWIQDGGGVVTTEAGAGRRLLVVEFPDASNPSGQILFDARQVVLDAGGVTTRVFAVTADGANAPALGRTEDGRRVYKRDVQASTYTPTSDLPFAVVFEVPLSSSEGTLWLGDRSEPLAW